jgi:predicted nuclease with RNAse H fold
MDKTRIIGIDCATVDPKVGLALGTADANGCVVERAAAWTKEAKVADTVAEWLGQSDRALVALDAPLGWPRPLGLGLADHLAGRPLAKTANELFRRETDCHVKEQYGKQPLDVGADRIARTAVSALSLLGEIRRITNLPIPLAWQPDYEDRVTAIEVYPAATLVACGLPAKSYKNKDQAAERRTIISGLERWMQLPAERNDMESNADVLDAAICVLAGFDFVAGNATAPTNLDLARHEGWIWVRKKAAMPEE